MQMKESLGTGHSLHKRVALCIPYVQTIKQRLSNVSTLFDGTIRHTQSHSIPQLSGDKKTFVSAQVKLCIIFTQEQSRQIQLLYEVLA